MRHYILTLMALLVLASAQAFAADSGKKPAKDSLNTAEPVEITAKTYDRNAGNRGVTFIPRGALMPGLKISVKGGSYDDFHAGPNNPDKNYGTTFSVNPQLMYSFAADNVVGVKFGYDRTTVDTESKIFEFEDPVTTKLEKCRYISNEYFGSLFWRRYISIAGSKRFALFAEVRAAVGGGIAKMDLKNEKNPSIVDRSEDLRTLDASIFFTPGLSIFINKLTCFEISLEALGGRYIRTEGYEGSQMVSCEQSYELRYKPNLLSLGFGLTFFIPVL